MRRQVAITTVTGFEASQAPCILFAKVTLHYPDWFKGEPIRVETRTGMAGVGFVVKAKRQELNYSRRAPGYFTLPSDKAPPAARDTSGVARA